jgi:hypothetical protein
MKKLIIILPIFLFISCEKEVIDPPIIQESIFPFTVDTVYYHTYPNIDSTDSRIVFKWNDFLPAYDGIEFDLSDMSFFIEKISGVAPSMSGISITGFTLFPSDFGVPYFEYGTIDKIRVREGSKIIYTHYE